MSRSAADLRRLADAVSVRREGLNLSVDECARRAKMSNTTWHKVEDGLTVRGTTYARVEQVLQWPAQTCAEILARPEFTPFPSDVAGGARYSQPPLPEDAVRLAVQSATIATTPDLTGAQIAALQEGVIEHLRRQGILKS